MGCCAASALHTGASFSIVNVLGHSTPRRSKDMLRLSSCSSSVFLSHVLKATKPGFVLLSVLSQVHPSVLYLCVFTRARFYCVQTSLLFCVRLSVPVQVIDGKESNLNWPVMMIRTLLNPTRSLCLVARVNRGPTEVVIILLGLDRPAPRCCVRILVG